MKHELVKVHRSTYESTCESIAILHVISMDSSCSSASSLPDLEPVQLLAAEPPEPPARPDVPGGAHVFQLESDKTNDVGQSCDPASIWDEERLGAQIDLFVQCLVRVGLTDGSLLFFTFCFSCHQQTWEDFQTTEDILPEEWHGVFL